MREGEFLRIFPPGTLIASGFRCPHVRVVWHSGMEDPMSKTSLSKAFRLALAGAAVFAVCAPNDARACGGTFCDSGPRAMPVDQTGENVLFVMDGTSVEAHVQIQYQGDPARFAWIV